VPFDEPPEQRLELQADHALWQALQAAPNTVIASIDAR